MPDITMDDADTVTLVYATHHGPGVATIALSVHELDPADPRRPGDVIVTSSGTPATREAAEDIANILAGAADIIRGSE